MCHVLSPWYFFFYSTNAYLGLITLQFDTVGLKSAIIGCGSRCDISQAWVCFFILLMLFLIILTKTDTLCRQMEVAEPEKGQKW